MEHLILYVGRHRGGEALNIKLVGIKAAGLHKELMPLLIGKANQLCFNRGTVSGALACYITRIHRAPIKV